MVERNDDVRVLDTALLVVRVDGLDLCHFLNHWHSVLRQLAHLGGNQSASNLLDLPLLNLLDVLQRSFLVQRRVAWPHHLHSLRELNFGSDSFHLLLLLCIVLDCAASFVVDLSLDAQVL